MRSLPSRSLAMAALVTVTVTLGACTGPSTGSSDPGNLTIGAVDLAAAGCPADIRIATNWFPGAEQGHLFQLVGPGYRVETESEYSISGPLMASGEYTGVDVTIIAGGAATFEATPPDRMMYDDPSILLGFVGSDEAVIHSGDQPTIGIFAPLEKDPRMIMWDPETLSDVTSIADLGRDGTTIKISPGETFAIDYLLDEGILTDSQLDRTLNSSFTPFVQAGGSIAQEGAATVDPYVYEHEIGDWLKPLTYELLYDAGYPNYASVVSTTPENLESYEECFTALVPVLQQAELDYFADPGAANSLILEVVDTYDTYWVYTPGLAQYAVTTQLETGIVGNGHDATVGNVDTERLQGIVDIAYDLYEDDDDFDLLPGLTAEDIFTDRFIDPSLGF
ncbi:hypothetical protein M2152_001744 [Microbacteriaceae bacterium SG_E_30_P1]|uniref:Nitrate ABC transporter substrate-binding protein n=1 Tax=Antiquaquibacter oligotrophicus TaxID=2880260 RepID=A0ABT6KQT1_9MICO|nr:ABC transporter substrate-binding protein [Antiquaquibacter oligotrophicus]MDH6181562.1 hypothetical protein [Antiquaquibacter oligotrophicus]UDF12750.1 ABC transporter substrate-binding protein [Antiquaquibacter oligotrophicus]